MARSPFNSPLVQIVWTDAVSGNTRSTFKRNDPLELRFGVRFEQNFWSSFEFASYWLVVSTFRQGTFITRYVLNGDIRTLPGAPASQLWVGMRFARAGQLSPGTWFSGTLTFRGELWISRSGGASNGLDQWAMAPREHAFLLKLFDFDPPEFTESLTLVGGPGTPPGTPLT
jgi:hypothetical protein